MTGETERQEEESKSEPTFEEILPGNLMIFMKNIEIQIKNHYKSYQEIALTPQKNSDTHHYKTVKNQI